IVVDALGRTIETVARNGSKPADWFRTRSTYDIRGNALTVTDALNRVAFRYTYDLANRPWRTDSIDASLRRMVLNPAPNHPRHPAQQSGAHPSAVRSPPAADPALGTR